MAMKYLYYLKFFYLFIYLFIVVMVNIYIFIYIYINIKSIVYYIRIVNYCKILIINNKYAIKNNVIIYIYKINI